MDDDRREETPDEKAHRLAFILLRMAEKGLGQKGLARLAGFSAGQASYYEQGKSPVPRDVVDRAAETVRFPAFLLDLLLREIRAFLVAGKGRSRADRAVAAGHAMERLALDREVTDLVLAPRRRPRLAMIRPPRAEDRTEQAEHVNFFCTCTPAVARLLVEEAPEYRTWVLCEAAALKSVRRAPNHPQEAREWAELAVHIAELVPAEETWRCRLLGWALHFLANALRACNDLPEAEKTRSRGRDLWEAGAPGDSGLLAEAWLPGLEANLRKDQRRFPEALRRINEALALDRGELRGEILMSKANILRRLDDPEGSTAALLEAERRIDTERQPRLAFGVRFNLLSDLCLLDRAAEAEPRLPAVQALAERLGEPLDLARCTWLHGQVHAGLGHREEALAAFRQVRQVFHEHELPYDYALVSLELALVLLELGRTAEVAEVAAEMVWIFEAQEVHREALAALGLFREAAEREAATVELVRRIERFLRRAQIDPDLRFGE